MTAGVGRRQEPARELRFHNSIVGRGNGGKPMLLFAVAHAVQLQDGIYAVRSPEFPDCEARHARIELAREQFGDVLRERLLRMIESGEVAALYTYEELGSSFAARCTMQLPAPDRMPGSFDRVMAVRAKLPPGAAERLRPIPAARPQELPVSESDSLPMKERASTESAEPSAMQAGEPSRDTSTPVAENRGTLGPSARLALVAAQLAGRDRHTG
jgi:DNA-binding TFAR19-related protein (PDSD5 family)